MGTIREWSDDDLNSKGTIPDRFSCKTNSRWSFFHPLKSLINPRYHIQTHSAALLECVSQFSIARNARIRKSTVLARNRNYQDHHPHYLELFWGISKERKNCICFTFNYFQKPRIRTFIHVNHVQSKAKKNVSLEKKTILLRLNICERSSSTHGRIPAPIECWSFQSFWQVFITKQQRSVRSRTQFLSAASPPSHATESIMRNKSSRKYFGLREEL
mgnify:FL=1